MVVAVTNKALPLINVSVPNIGFPEFTVVCNIFWSGDCLTIHGNTLNVELVNGETKIFLPKSSDYFKTAKLRRRPTSSQI